MDSAEDVPGAREGGKTPSVPLGLDSQLKRVIRRVFGAAHLMASLAASSMWRRRVRSLLGILNLTGTRHLIPKISAQLRRCSQDRAATDEKGIAMSLETTLLVTWRR